MSRCGLCQWSGQCEDERCEYFTPVVEDDVSEVIEAGRKEFVEIMVAYMAEN